MFSVAAVFGAQKLELSVSLCFRLGRLNMARDNFALVRGT